MAHKNHQEQVIYIPFLELITGYARDCARIVAINQRDATQFIPVLRIIDGARTPTLETKLPDVPKSRHRQSTKH